MIKFSFRNFCEQDTESRRKNLMIKVENLKNKNFSKFAPENEYKFMLEKCLAQYYKIKWIQNRRKYKFYIFASISAFSIFQLIKYYYIIYYYIMWEIDIRKPRVSDYIVERFR
jgi:hypothetical protein